MLLCFDIIRCAKWEVYILHIADIPFALQIIVPAYSSRDLVIPNICPSVLLKHFFVDTITHWTVWRWPSSTVFFARSQKLIIFTHCTMNGGHFVDTITHLTVWHWPLIMVSTVSWDYEKLLFWPWPSNFVIQNFELFHIVPWMGSLCGHCM